LAGVDWAGAFGGAGDTFAGDGPGPGVLAAGDIGAGVPPVAGFMVIPPWPAGMPGMLWPAGALAASAGALAAPSRA
jgi:hypothetical protein